MMLWGLRRFSRPPYGTLLKLEARGLRDGGETRLTLSVFHPDGYVLTAAPMVACLLQVLDGTARRPGLHFQALLAEPARMLADMKQMGVEVTMSETSPSCLPR
jgi:saccharopine dehydrogenase (NAD+, L-lysine-forming)